MEKRKFDIGSTVISMRMKKFKQFDENITSLNQQKSILFFCYNQIYTG